MAWTAPKLREVNCGMEIKAAADLWSRTLQTALQFNILAPAMAMAERTFARKLAAWFRSRAKEYPQASRSSSQLKGGEPATANYSPTAPQ